MHPEVELRPEDLVEAGFGANLATRQQARHGLIGVQCVGLGIHPAARDALSHSRCDRVAGSRDSVVELDQRVRGGLEAGGAPVPHAIVIIAVDEDAREEMDIDYAGDELQIGFNSKYLIDALSVSGAKEVRFGLQDDLFV